MDQLSHWGKRARDHSQRPHLLAFPASRLFLVYPFFLQLRCTDQVSIGKMAGRASDVSWGNVSRNGRIAGEVVLVRG